MLDELADVLSAGPTRRVSPVPSKASTAASQGTGAPGPPSHSAPVVQSMQFGTIVPQSPGPPCVAHGPTVMHQFARSCGHAKAGVWSQKLFITQPVKSPHEHWILNLAPQVRIVVVVVELVVVVAVVSVVVVAVVVVGTQHAVPQSPTPVGQQRPNKFVDFLTMAFAQCRVQQLMSVEQTVPFDLHPPARACVLTRSAVLATSARRAVR